MPEWFEAANVVAACVIGVFFGGVAIALFCDKMERMFGGLGVVISVPVVIYFGVLVLFGFFSNTF